MKYTILFISALLMTCGKKSSDKMLADQDNNDVRITKMIVIDGADNCFPERKVVSELKDQMAEVIQKDGTYFFAFENTHLEVCSLPEQVRIEGKVFKIDGEVLEIYPNERRRGTPFRLRKIQPE